ncbi:MAG: hypothetical protein AMXMBFR33_32700 [Candidatus Xenobia bacterium]
MLLETIFGIGLFSVSILLLFSIFPTAHRSATQAKNMSIASNLCREILEEQVRARPFATIVSITPEVPVPLGTVGARVQGVDTVQDFRYEVLVDSEPTPSPNLKHVLAIVRWDEGVIRRQVRMETYVADY